jgi:hypothetical protein
MPGDTPRDPLLHVLDRHGVGVRRVRYRANRSVLLSVSVDGETLNSHECFRDAPGPILEAIARFLRARRGSAGQREALAVIRDWEGARRGIARVRASRAPRRAGPGPGAAVQVLQGLFDRFNRERFHGCLPAVPLRISRRMSRSLGTIACEQAGSGRVVRGITISADLLVQGNEAVLLDTMLHEMAHAEAWLEHGHRGHGAVWRRIAVRVGCSPRARTEARIRRVGRKPGR